MTKSKNNKMSGGQVSSQTNAASVGGKTFVFAQPMNFIFFISFFSPIILVILIVSMSFFFHNFKGLI